MTQNKEREYIYEENGKFRVNLSLGWKVIGGKRIRDRKKIYCDTFQEAKKVRNELLAKKRAGEAIPTDRVTLKQFLEDWLEEESASVRYKTAKYYRNMCVKHLIPALGHIKLKALTQHDVRDFLKSKISQKSPTTGKPFAPATVKGMQRTLSVALNHAYSAGMISKNVAEAKAIGRIRYTVDETPTEEKIRALSPEQAKALVHAADLAGWNHGMLITMLIATGMRVGEALALSWDEVDLATGCLHIRWTLQRQDGKLVRVKPKSAKSNRSVYLPSSVLEKLKQYRRTVEDRRSLAGTAWKGNPWNLILVTTIGSAHNERNVLRAFQNHILPAAGLPKMRIHDLRHSFTTISIGRGCDLKTVSATLGHSSTGFTMSTYSHVLDSGKKNSAENLTDLFQ